MTNYSHLSYEDRKNIEDVVQNAIGEFSRTMALRVDVHYPPILDRGDTVCCFPNLDLDPPSPNSFCILS